MILMVVLMALLLSVGVSVGRRASYCERKANYHADMERQMEIAIGGTYDLEITDWMPGTPHAVTAAYYSQKEKERRQAAAPFYRKRYFHFRMKHQYQDIQWRPWLSLPRE